MPGQIHPFARRAEVAFDIAPSPPVSRLALREEIACTTFTPGILR